MKPGPSAFRHPQVARARRAVRRQGLAHVLPVLAIAALLIGFAGGVIGRKTAVVTEVFTSQKVRLSNHGAGQSPESGFAKVAAAVANAVVEVVATSGPAFRRALG